MAEPNFDTIKQTAPNGTEVWRARDLMPLLGYNDWKNFHAVIKKGITACELALQAVPDHFVETKKISEGGKGAKRAISDYFLSRLACYLTAQNGDSKKPEIAAAQAYFAISTQFLEMHILRADQERRLAIRIQVADENTKLFDAAAVAGVLSENFGLFNDAGYEGLYKLTAAEIVEYKNLPQNEPLDYMPADELALNLVRITQTENKLVRDNVQGENEAIRTHFGVAREIRHTVERLHGPLPEDIPAAPSIRALLEEKRRKARKRLRKSPPDEQDTLF